MLSKVGRPWDTVHTQYKQGILFHVFRSFTFKYQVDTGRGLGGLEPRNTLSSLLNFKPVLTSVYPNAYGILFLYPSKNVLIFFHLLKLISITPNTNQISIVSKSVLGEHVPVLN